MNGFVVAHILDDFTIGDQFTIWPLHVTILPPFEAPDLETVKQVLQPIVAAAAPIPVQLGDFAKFGRDKVAQKVVLNPELAALHNKLLQAAEQQGWAVAGRYTGRYYMPHITRKMGRDYRGDSFLIDRLIIADSLPQGYRSIAAILSLQGKSMVE